MELIPKPRQKIGRPKVTDRPGFNEAFGDILERLAAGEISRRQAAKVLNIGHATLNRLTSVKKSGETGTS
jgi:putative DNA-invertase from lambdoid prophage Rac